VSNAETITTNAADDTVTLATGLTGAVIDLGGGTNKLNLATAANTFTMSNVESVVGGSSDDKITFLTQTTAGRYDLGSGVVDAAHTGQL